MNRGIGVKKIRGRCFDEYDEECDHCGSGEDVDVHHIDGDATNNNIENLIPLCRSCHKKVHYKHGTHQKYWEHLPEDSVIETMGETVIKAVNITEGQKEWLDENDRNLSDMVRAEIEVKMEVNQ